MQEDNHIFQGLRRDNHQIRQDSKFLWDAHNIRITNRDDSTLLSLSNERGTSDALVTFKGEYVGHCVIGKYLVVFTAIDGGAIYIYRVEKVGNKYKNIILFSSTDEREIGWKPGSPIEAIGFYETELIQKVYWIDEGHSPRVINIAKPELRIPSKKLYDTIMVDGIVLSDPSHKYYGDDESEELTKAREALQEEFPNGLYTIDQFDFVRTLNLNETVSISKVDSSGMLSPGTIQYAFTYYDKYGQESNIFYTSPLYYISPSNRGGSPEERVSVSFKITIKNPDSNFDYLRVYSIHRTSIDAVPTVKIVNDLALKNIVESGESSEISTVDTGTIGETIDSTQLLYIGGKSIVAKSMTHKDGTLFLGNITLKSDHNEKEIEEVIKTYILKNTVDETPVHDTTYKNLSLVTGVSTGGDFYHYSPSLSGMYSGIFKTNETYRCGIQVQAEDGTWLQPIFLGDFILAKPSSLRTTEADYIHSSVVQFDSPKDLFTELKALGAKRIRTCVVFPSTSERDILCQGVLCPTVCSTKGRRDNSPFSMASWFFRPAVGEGETSSLTLGSKIQFKHNKPLFTGANRGAEVQNMLDAPGIQDISDITSENVDKYSTHFFVDENIVTFHSPDLEFDTNLSNLDWKNVDLKIIGIAQMGAVYGDIDIQVSTPPAGNVGFYHTTAGFPTSEVHLLNGGYVANTAFLDSAVNSEDWSTTGNYWWMVYPWHRSGSLNNDVRRPADSGIRTAVLSKKKLSNMKFFDRNMGISEDLTYRISPPVLFNSNEVTLAKIETDLCTVGANYLGNVDSMVSSTNSYSLYAATTLGGENFDIYGISNEPVRMKYKSSPHLVFSLKGDSPDIVELLPRHRAIGNPAQGNYTLPGWQQKGDIFEYRYDAVLGAYKIGGSYEQLSWFHNGLNKSPYKEVLEGKRVVGGNFYNYGVVVNGVPVREDESLKAPLGRILKALPNGVLLPSGDGYLLPGTSTSDYQVFHPEINSYYKIYIGKERYYKIISASGSGNLFDLEEVVIETSETPTSKVFKLEQKIFGDRDDRNGEYPYLLIGELINKNVQNKFGGTTEMALENNLWLPACEPISLNEESVDTDDLFRVPFVFGDTWYGRYDCLKTYAFTPEDENQVIEIGSFLCESRINLDGRYDKNIGQLSNLNTSPQNFNLFNEIYSQKDNYFTYRKLDEDLSRQQVFTNQITWTKQKNPGEDIDSWTNITMANTLDVNGSRGPITALSTFNEHLLCFQEGALNQIMFNSRVQIPVSDGVPVEIANGYKVDGTRIINEFIGCKNKWSICNTTRGLYFIDANSNSIYKFDGQLTNLSDSLGMKWWVKDVGADTKWTPSDSNTNGLRVFKDESYSDLYFTPGLNSRNQKDALCFSEQLEQFTSLMSYGGTQAMFNYAGGFYSLRGDEGGVTLYQNNVGPYNNFYGTIKGWDFSFISNQNPTLTKIFNTVELRADHYQTANEKLLNSCPINFIKAENEYQNTGIVYTDNNTMRKKFRVWRGLIPRSSKVADVNKYHFNQDGSDISRKCGRARIRNPWSMITLGWTPKSENTEDNTRKVVVHDVSVKYTV